MEWNKQMPISSQRIGNHFQNHLCFNLHACLISPCRLCWSWIFGILRGLRMLLVIFGCNTVLIQSHINWLWLIYSWTNFLGPTWTAAPPRIILTYMAYCATQLAGPLEICSFLWISISMISETMIQKHQPANPLRPWCCGLQFWRGTRGNDNGTPPPCKMHHVPI